MRNSALNRDAPLKLAKWGDVPDFGSSEKEKLADALDKPKRLRNL
jgi:hypothetical protein